MTEWEGACGTCGEFSEFSEFNDGPLTSLTSLKSRTGIKNNTRVTKEGGFIKKQLGVQTEIRTPKPLRGSPPKIICTDKLPSR